MTYPASHNGLLQERLFTLLHRLPHHKHGDLIHAALDTLLRIADEDFDRLDWKILTASLQDLEKACLVFYPYRHIRKIAIFGSSQLPPDSPEYKMATEFAHRVTQAGFMVMTGAGGGIMAAANKGAGAKNSFGLNINLPFEQGANPFIDGDPKLVKFKYFFTRKLFFLRETDAIALFPGGFGTQDEAFECLTLCQTGKLPPIPVVLLDPSGGTYWREWDQYLQTHLIQRQMISAHDDQLYTIVDNLDDACAAIDGFYQVYHSSRYVGDRLVIRLNHELSDAEVDTLNQQFLDILIQGKIQKSGALPEETQQPEPQPQQMEDRTEHLPRLVFHFNQRDHGRLYQMIATLNTMGPTAKEGAHPERK